MPTSQPAALQPKRRLGARKGILLALPHLICLFLLGLAACTKRPQSQEQQPEQSQNAVGAPAVSDTVVAERPKSGDFTTRKPAEPEPIATGTPVPKKSARLSKTAVAEKKRFKPKAEALTATPAPTEAVEPQPTKLAEAKPAESERVAFRPRFEQDSGFICDPRRFVKYTRLHNGKGGFMRGKLLERNSTDCGYVAAAKPEPKPVAVAGIAEQPAAPAKPSYLNKTVDQMKEEGLIKRDEFGNKKNN